MPIIRLKEIRDMSSEDRAKKLDEYRTELLRLKTMIGAGGTVENPARVKTLRKTIARVLTVEHEQTRGTGETEAKKTVPKKTEQKKTAPKKARSKKAESKKAEPKKGEKK